MSLGLRLNLLVASVLTLLLAAGGALIVEHARESVADEMDSAVKLTLQLLAAASGPIAVPDGTGDTGAGTAASPVPGALRIQPDLLRRLASLQDVRHVEIVPVQGGGPPPFAPRDRVGATDGAPAWFRKIVAPDPIEYRQQYGPPGSGIEIALRPNPADEIAEAWAESRSTFGLLLAFATLVMVLTSFTLHHAFRPIAHIVTALGRLERGDFEAARLKDFALPELRRIATRFNHVVDTMMRQREENRALSHKALAIQEAERRHLARELHDEFGQSISAIKALAVATRRRPEAIERTREHAVTITGICDHAYDVVRRLMSELRPATLDSLGIVASLDRLVEDWRARHESVALTCALDEALKSLPDDAAIKVFRIVQECLTNISRHAQASRVGISLAIDSARERIRLEVEDDGRGFDPAGVQAGLGLLGIRERVTSLNGEVEVLSAPGLGTRVRLDFPIPAAACGGAPAQGEAGGDGDAPIAAAVASQPRRASGLASAAPSASDTAPASWAESGSLSAPGPVAQAGPVTADGAEAVRVSRS